MGRRRRIPVGPLELEFPNESFLNSISAWRTPLFTEWAWRIVSLRVDSRPALLFSVPRVPLHKPKDLGRLSSTLPGSTSLLRPVWKLSMVIWFPLMGGLMLRSPEQPHVALPVILCFHPIFSDRGGASDLMGVVLCSWGEHGLLMGKGSCQRALEVVEYLLATWDQTSEVGRPVQVGGLPRSSHWSLHWQEHPCALDLAFTRSLDLCFWWGVWLMPTKGEPADVFPS